MSGLSRRFAHPGEVLPQQQPVDDGGLAHIGAARKGHLGKTVTRAVGERRNGTDKFYIVNIHRQHLLANTGLVSLVLFSAYRQLRLLGHLRRHWLFLRSLEVQRCFQHGIHMGHR